MHILCYKMQKDYHTLFSYCILIHEEKSMFIITEYYYISHKIIIALELTLDFVINYSFYFLTRLKLHIYCA